MSIDYCLYLSTPVPADKFAYAKSRSFYETANNTPPHPQTQRMVLDAFGFVPEMSLIFFLSDDHIQEAQDTIISTLASALKSYRGHAAFVMATGPTFLISENGIVSLNADLPDFWTEKRTSLFTGARTQPLPVL